MIGRAKSRGHDQGNPVLVFLYGGQGSPALLVQIHFDDTLVLVNLLRECFSRENNTGHWRNWRRSILLNDDDTFELGVQRQWLYSPGGGIRGTIFGQLGAHFLFSPEYSIS